MNDPTHKVALPISIELGTATSTPYKSIQRVVWTDVPPFAVLTGPNGSGKTQFLQVLAYRLAYREARSRSRGPVPSDMLLKIIGDEIGPHQVAYLPNAENAFHVGSTTIGNLHQAKTEFLQRLQPQNVEGNIEAQILRERVQQQFGIQIHSDRATPEMIAKLPDDFTFMLEYGDVSKGLSHVFVGHQVRRAERLLEGQTEADILKEIGAAPWEFVNQVLGAAEFGYRIIPPEKKLLKDYRVRLESVDRKTILEFNDLSSGEKAILRTILWFYNTKHHNIFPKLFIMDEPDAHLHPSMTRQFIDILKNVLVDQYGTRVILSTHSPSTVALAPDSSIFVMSRQEPRIQRATSKADAIGLLTSGLVFVSPGTKFVLVEDEDDVKFYDAVRDVLADQGPSRDSKALKPAPSIVFMPASIGKGDAKIAGGKSRVEQWVEKFNAAPLDQMFRGVIDRDANNAGGPRVHVLGRYSIENYQLDPIVVFGVLIDEKKAPSLSSVTLTQGDEHRLRALPAESLQDVVDYVAREVEVKLAPLDAAAKSLMNVKFTNDVELKYPAWMLTRRGHDLLPIYQKIFGQAVITPPKLQKSFRRVRLVPIELAHIMHMLQEG